MENEEYEGRIKALGIMVVMVIAILMARVGYLQVFDGEYYASLADGNRIRIIPFYVSFNQKTYLKEQEEIGIPEFYSILNEGRIIRIRQILVG